MRAQQADYGFIIATCENDKPIRPLDLRKKIYISGDNNNLFVVAKIMRELLITKHNFKQNSSIKERKIKNLDEWINDKLPRYISSLEEEFDSQEKETNNIISKAEKIKNSTEKILEMRQIDYQAPCFEEFMKTYQEEEKIVKSYESVFQDEVLNGPQYDIERNTNHIKFKFDDNVEFSNGSFPYIHCVNESPFNSYKVGEQVEIEMKKAKRMTSNIKANNNTFLRIADAERH
ncbi:5054_t:CDS:2 [Racocetra fulgida]|uniref:5054_t:CDS:1 n=1 Tax=Racocetra fulgida TaxID=60492 RepID=A0A9N9NDT1_9GLOM|nr:5054_t:CDS:2 [Racocetra fulgida]